MRSVPPLALAAVALAGCSAAVPDVPSIGPRPAEHQRILPPDAASEPETAADPALVKTLAALVAEARTGHAAYERERAATVGALARAEGAAEGGEAWIAGQEALSAREAARVAVGNAAAAIDALRGDPAHTGTGDRAAIDKAAAEVGALAAREAAPATR